MMTITKKIKVATNYMRQLKKDITLLTLNMDIVREVGEREFNLLKSKFYLLRAQHERYRDIAYDIVVSAHETDEETMFLARELQDVSDQCRIKFDLMNSSFIRFAFKHFKAK